MTRLNDYTRNDNDLYGDGLYTNLFLNSVEHLKHKADKRYLLNQASDDYTNRTGKTAFKSIASAKKHEASRYRKSKERSYSNQINQKSIIMYQDEFNQVTKYVRSTEIMKDSHSRLTTLTDNKRLAARFSNHEIEQSDLKRLGSNFKVVPIISDN